MLVCKDALAKYIDGLSWKFMFECCQQRIYLFTNESVHRYLVLIFKWTSKVTLILLFLSQKMYNNLFEKLKNGWISEFVCLKDQYLNWSIWRKIFFDNLWVFKKSENLCIRIGNKIFSFHGYNNFAYSYQLLGQKLKWNFPETIDFIISPVSWN